MACKRSRQGSVTSIGVLILTLTLSCNGILHRRRSPTISTAAPPFMSPRGTSILVSRSLSDSSSRFGNTNMTQSQFEGNLTDSMNNQIQSPNLQNATFDIWPNCPSTLNEINFCGNLDASDSYGDSGNYVWDSTCEAACDTAYGGCEATCESCKAACCYGCPWGKICSCSSVCGCGDMKSDCMDGCKELVTGSIEVGPTKLTGLGSMLSNAMTVKEEEKATAASTTYPANFTWVVPHETTVKVYLHWKMCSLDICVSDTTPVSATSTVGGNGTGSAITTNCDGGSPSGPQGVNMSFSNLKVGSVSWDMTDFYKAVNDAIEAYDDTLGWLLGDFNVNAMIPPDEQQAAAQKALDSAVSMLNQQFSNTTLFNVECTQS